MQRQVKLLSGEHQSDEQQLFTPKRAQLDQSQETPQPHKKPPRELSEDEEDFEPSQKDYECLTPEPSKMRQSCETPQLDESLSKEQLLEEELTLPEDEHYRKKLFSDCTENSYNICDQVTEIIKC